MLRGFFMLLLLAVFCAGLRTFKGGFPLNRDVNLSKVDISKLEKAGVYSSLWKCLYQFNDLKTM
jgi:hypothetical protein